jgi:hypothetical protein
VGGTIGVVGGVGTLAGKILETAGDLLDAAAGILGGGVMLIGEVLDTTGEGIGMALSTVGRSVARAGDVVAGTNAGAENPESVVDAPPAPVTSGTRVRRAGTAPPKRAAKKPAPATR